LQAKVGRRQAELALALWTDLQEVVDQGQPADDTLKAVFRRHRELGSRDRRFLSNLLFAAFRWKGWLPSDDAGRQLAMAWALDATEPHPACDFLCPDETFAVCGEASLDRKSQQIKAWTKADAAPDLQALAPDWLEEEWAAEAGDLTTWLSLIQSRPPVVVRNRGHLPTAELTAHPALRGAWYSSDTRQVTELSQKHVSEIQIQNLASQCVGHIAKPSPGSSWWDACSGAGGKSIHLADLMHGRGRIWATDTRRAALNDQHRRCRSYGIDIIRSRRFDLLKDDAPQSSFDGVLVDAPCTGLGTWARNPDPRWRTPVKDVHRAAKRQLQMLTRASEAVRPGGRLVYSVCTLTEKETQGVTEAFLQARPDMTLAPVAHPLRPDDRSATHWIRPEEALGDGMFVAHFKRK